jgi:hypothetical protein
MNNWYRNLTKQQKIYIYLLALAVPWAFALLANSLALLMALYIPLALLIFLELGPKEKSE